MKVLRSALLVAAALLSLLFLIAFFRVISPLLEDRGIFEFTVISIPDVAFLRFWDHERKEFGPLTLQWFKVADDPTGHATVRYRFHSCYLALPAAGILIYALYKLAGRLRRATLMRSKSLEVRKLLTGK